VCGGAIRDGKVEEEEEEEEAGGGREENEEIKLIGVIKNRGEVWATRVARFRLGLFPPSKNAHCNIYLVLM
jgi:hypothetical protein